MLIEKMQSAFFNRPCDKLSMYVLGFSQCRSCKHDEVELVREENTSTFNTLISYDGLVTSGTRYHMRSQGTTGEE